ncbi:MAG: PEGA domain-containing protein [Candidatus Andersenbacteria bacterium]
MQARTRTLLFVLIVVLFVVVAPVLVLYAKGYSFRTDRRSVVRTGMILIDTNVPKVTVRVDGGQPNLENDPVILRGLEAGTYHVALSREGYEPWEADLTVEAEKVTRLDGLLLVLSAPKVQQPITDQIGRFAVSPNSRFVLYTVTSGTDRGLWMHTNGEETNRLLAGPNELDPSSISELRWAQNSRLLLVRDKSNTYWRISPHVTTPTLVKLSTLSGVVSSNVELDLDEPTIVYFLDSKQRLWRWSTARQDAEPEQLASTVQAFAVASPKVFSLTTTAGTTTLNSYDMRENAPQPDTIAALPQAVVDPASLSITSQGASLVAVLADQQLWLLKRVNGNFTFTSVAQNVSRALWSPTGTALLYQRDRELWIRDLEPLAEQTPDFMIATLAQPPTKVTWHPDGHYVAIMQQAEDQTSVALAFASRTAPHVQPLGKFTTQLLPQFARGGLDVLYSKTGSAKERGLVFLTIAEQLN